MSLLHASILFAWGLESVPGIVWFLFKQTAAALGPIYSYVSVLCLECSAKSFSLFLVYISNGATF